MSLKLDNLIALFDYLSAVQWRSADQVAGKLGVDRRTVFRYMNEIELAFDPMPILERGPDGYRLCRNDFLETLQYRDDYTGLAAVMASPIGALIRPARPLPEKLVAAVMDTVETGGVLAATIIRPLFEAMRTGNYLEIPYRAKADTKRHRCVPVKFFLRSGISYFVCYDAGYGHLIVLGADKMEGAFKTKDFLPLSELKELRDYVNSAWGLMVRHEQRLTCRIEFEANPSVAAYFLKAPLHRSQEHRMKDDRSVFGLTVHSEGEFARFILRFGRAVRIRAPKSAVSEMKTFLADMAEFYRSKEAPDA